MVSRDGGFVSILSTTTLNDLALRNLIDTGQTGRPDFKRVRPCRLPSLFPLSLPPPFPLSPHPSFVQVVGRWMEVRFTRWTERRRGGRSGSDPVYQGIVGRRARRSNSESVRTIIWRWQRDGQNERSTSPSALTSSSHSFLSSSPSVFASRLMQDTSGCIKCDPRSHQRNMHVSLALRKLDVC